MAAGAVAAADGAKAAGPDIKKFPQMTQKKICLRFLRDLRVTNT